MKLTSLLVPLFYFALGHAPFLNAAFEDPLTSEQIEQHQINLDISPTLNLPIIDRPVSYANFKVIEIIAKSSKQQQEEYPIIPSIALMKDFLASPPPTSQPIHNNSNLLPTLCLPTILYQLNPCDGFQIWESNSTYIKALVNPSIYHLLTNLTDLHIELLNANLQEDIDRENFDISHSKTLKANTNSLVPTFLSS
jgi:hypothetical protein